MESKIFEVRAEGSFIPVMAIRLDASNDAEAYLLGRSGYGLDPVSWHDYIFLFPIEVEGPAVTDPFKQKIPELQIAHSYVSEHFDELKPGDVLDVDFIAGKRPAPRKSDRFWQDEREAT
jgi:hypothetical protein